MGSGSNAPDYRSEIDTGLAQANQPKSDLAQNVSGTLQGSYLPALQGLLNAGGLGNAYKGTVAGGGTPGLIFNQNPLGFVQQNTGLTSGPNNPNGKAPPAGWAIPNARFDSSSSASANAGGGGGYGGDSPLNPKYNANGTLDISQGQWITDPAAMAQYQQLYNQQNTSGFQSLNPDQQETFNYLRQFGVANPGENQPPTVGGDTTGIYSNTLAGTQNGQTSDRAPYYQNIQDILTAQANGTYQNPNNNGYMDSNGHYIPGPSLGNSNGSNGNTNGNYSALVDGHPLSIAAPNLANLDYSSLNSGAAGQASNTLLQQNNINPLNDQYYQALMGTLNNTMNQGRADLRSRFGSSGGASRGTPAAYAESQFDAQNLPQIAATLGAAQQQSFGNQLQQAGLNQQGANSYLSALNSLQSNQNNARLGQNSLLAQLGQYNAGQQNSTGLAYQGQQQAANQAQIQNQFAGLQSILGLTGSLAGQGIPGGSGNVNLGGGSQPNSGNSTGSTLAGIGSLLGALAMYSQSS